MEKIDTNVLQKEGMVVESDRILVYSKLFCPLDCKYCFAEDLNIEENSQRFYLSVKQLELLRDLPEEIKTIMLGCDTEFFLNEDEAIKILGEVSVLNKDVSVITKLSLSDKIIRVLKEISDLMKTRNNILSFSISIPCFESSKLWEPKAPKVRERIETLRKVFEIGIPAMVAIRPLIPNISVTELDKITKLTYPYVFGYYSGPLYVKDLNNGVISAEDLKNPDLVVSETLTGTPKLRHFLHQD